MIAGRLFKLKHNILVAEFANISYFTAGNKMSRAKKSNMFFF